VVHMILSSVCIRTRTLYIYSEDIVCTLSGCSQLMLG